MARQHDIRVDVRTSYVPEQSDAAEPRYAFSYTITITNAGSAPAQLISRHWVITDANADIQEVRGMGVIGEQPHLAPGERFEYTSGTLLATTTGVMRGSYQMLADDGTRFEAEVPEFVLVAPHALH